MGEAKREHRVTFLSPGTSSMKSPVSPYRMGSRRRHCDGREHHRAVRARPYAFYFGTVHVHPGIPDGEGEFFPLTEAASRRLPSTTSKEDLTYDKAGGSTAISSTCGVTAGRSSSRRRTAIATQGSSTGPIPSSTGMVTSSERGATRISWRHRKKMIARVEGRRATRLTREYEEGGRPVGNVPTLHRLPSSGMSGLWRPRCRGTGASHRPEGRGAPRGGEEPRVSHPHSRPRGPPLRLLGMSSAATGLAPPDPSRPPGGRPGAGRRHRPDGL